MTQSGGFAQWGGMRVSFDPTDALGSRVKSVALLDFDGHVIARVIEDGQVLPDAPATISMVTGNFTADGGDGYPIKANASNFRYLLADGTLSAAVDESIALNSAAGFTAAGVTSAQVLGQQQAFKDYLQAFHATPGTAYDQADGPAGSDQRVQNLDLKATDTVFEGEDLTGTRAAEALDGFAGDDVLKGRAGNDSLDGGVGNDRLVGQAGADELFGGAGDDRLLGGDGADRFVFDGAAGSDRILDFVAGEDQIVLMGLGFADFAAVQAAMKQRPGGVRLTLDADSEVFIKDATIAGLDASDFVLL